MVYDVYKILLNHYGPRGWWPINGKYRPKVYKNKNDNERFEIIIGTILTQNTAWKNVEKALLSLKQKNLLSPNKILSVGHDKLAGAIRSSGYFNQKAKRLKTMCKFLADNPISELKKLPVLKLRDKLLKINGIGPETADSIMLYATEKEIFVIDAYTRRIFSRFHGRIVRSTGYDVLQKYIVERIPKSLKIYNEYHALLVELAKDFCRKKPLCEDCPLTSLCKLTHDL